MDKQIIEAEQRLPQPTQLKMFTEDLENIFSYSEIENIEYLEWHGVKYPCVTLEDD